MTTNDTIEQQIDEQQKDLIKQASDLSDIVEKPLTAKSVIAAFGEIARMEINLRNILEKLPGAVPSAAT
jgi:hypothetical protein